MDSTCISTHPKATLFLRQLLKIASSLMQRILVLAGCLRCPIKKNILIANKIQLHVRK
ncbi:hypothetical protein SAMN05192529_1143 [Arachidicoccus rhizosphaerae]|uniref:Uncharacterized protein n=1 Tax=Arachidicoccus rhizosphaerae TaxID=551991 RepID=A0A1H4ABR1_9BACT|nr:hypothetical protein SAMN05192529_1143 [Arachidicoccus rhizosphaerae]